MARTYGHVAHAEYTNIGQQHPGCKEDTVIFIVIHRAFQQGTA